MRYSIILSIFFFFSIAAKAQTNTTIYNMEQLPQASEYNVGQIPDGKIFIGLPFLSNHTYNSNSAFRYGDLFRNLYGSKFNSPMEMLNSLNSDIPLNATLRTSIISGGFVVKQNNYFNFAVNERMSSGFHIPNELNGILQNNYEPYFNNTVNSSAQLNFNHYREYAFGYTRRLNHDLSIGARFKYLYGMENMTTHNAEISAGSSLENQKAQVSGDIHVQSSGIRPYLDGSGELPFHDKKHYLFGMDNKGMALDFGINYNPGPFRFGFSMLDLGHINWNENIHNLRAENFNHTYTAADYSKNSKNTENVNVWDTINAHATITEDGYRTSLPMQTFSSVGYEFNEKHRVDVLMSNLFADGNATNTYALNYSTKLTPHLWLTGTYSKTPGLEPNYGMGLSTSGLLQFYFVSDNVRSIFNHSPNRISSTRFGVNLRID